VLKAQFTVVKKGHYMGGIDLIFTNGVPASSSRSVSGSPSDHPFVAATIGGSTEVPETPTNEETPADADCTSVDNDPWMGGQYKRCCGELEECTEDRDPNSPIFAQYPTVQMCRTSCDATSPVTTQAPTPAPAPVTTPAQAGVDTEVATFNLYEWNVGANNRWGQLYAKIQSQTFDIIGFQEITTVSKIINNVARMRGWDYYEPKSISGYNDNPSPIAWDNKRFKQLASGWKKVGSDSYGQRGVAWVRLSDTASGSRIFFANTHGPLSSCPESLGQNWLSVVTDNIVSGDILVYVGDFNCNEWTPAINVLKAQFTTVKKGDYMNGIDLDVIE
jgi:endonuclease/exonuclease/phosphatase family metal-dependent hydrolase